MTSLTDGDGTKVGGRRLDGGLEGIFTTEKFCGEVGILIGPVIFMGDDVVPADKFAGIFIELLFELLDRYSVTGVVSGLGAAILGNFNVRDPAVGVEAVTF